MNKEKKTEYLGMKMTETQKEILRTRAKKKGLTMSAYILMRAVYSKE